MSHLVPATVSEDGLLNESSLPVELQTQNVVNSSYILPIIPVSITNGSAMAPRPGTFNGTTHEEPYIVISEQPQQRGFRFRYECEGPSHGGLQGTRSERNRKSFPTIKVENYTGALRIVVSLVTDEKSPRPHAHKLVGANCKDGFCNVEIKANSEPISFPNICILHVTRRKLVDVLTERVLDTIKLKKKVASNNINIDQPITEEDKRMAKTQAEDQSKNMQLNVVRLCFTAFLKNHDGSYSKMLQPVFSQPIFDSKSPGASALKICRMDKYGGCCSGNEEVFLLCEKVQKDDILVRFVEQNEDGSVKWEAYGNFGPLDVHRQYAIVFKTPAYWNTNIDKAVNVLIMLQRKSDKEVSEPKAFTYFPQNRDKDNIASKKRKRIPLDGFDYGGGDGGGGGGGSGFGAGGLGPDGGANGSTDGHGLDLSGKMDGGMGGGMGGGGGGGGGMNMMRMYDGNGVLFPTMIPKPVEDVVKSEFFQHPMLESDRLRATLNSTHQQHVYDSFFSSDFDPWICSDIEVDAAPESPQPRIQRPELGQGIKLSPAGDDDDCVDGLFPNRGKDVVETFHDSGIGRKSIPLQDTKVQADADPKSGSKQSEEKEEELTLKSSSDYQSEPDVKVEEVVSLGIKSDEGFSETSEEVANKTQLPHVKTKGSVLDSGTSKVHMSELSKGQLSNITEIVRKVTSRVSERTIAALVDYAETGDIRHLLLVQRQLMTISNKNGDLPLHLAVINSQPVALKSMIDVVCTLPDSKDHINTLNYMRQTQLHLASIMNQPDIVETLLHAGADPSIPDRHGNTAAHLAVMNGAQACLSSLVKYLRPGQTSDDPFPELNHLNYDGYTPLHLAAQAGNVDMLRTLIFGQADVNLPDGKSGKSALHHAVDNDDLPVAGFLLMEAKTFVNARCYDGNTALHIACARQLVAMVALLVTAGADQTCENEEIPDPEEDGDGELEASGSSSGSDHRARDRPGLRPVDYADNNEQILKILSGETDTDGLLSQAPPPGGEADLTSIMSQMALQDVTSSPTFPPGNGRTSDIPFTA